MHLHPHCIHSDTEIVLSLTSNDQLSHPSEHVAIMTYTILVTLGACYVPKIFTHIGGTFWTGFTVLSQYGMVVLC